MCVHCQHVADTEVVEQVYHVISGEYIYSHTVFKYNVKVLVFYTSSLLHEAHRESADDKF